MDEAAYKQRFKQFVNEVYQYVGSPQGQKLKEFVELQFGDLLSVSGFRNWLRGDHVSYDVRQLQVLSRLRQIPFTQTIEYLYGAAETMGGEAQRGEFLMLTYLESAEPSVLWRIVKAAIAHLDVHMPLTFSALLPSTAAVMAEDDAEILSTRPLMYSAAKLKNLLHQFVNPDDPDAIAAFVFGHTELLRVAMTAAIKGKLTDKEIDPDFLRAVRISMERAQPEQNGYLTLEWLQTQIEAPQTGNNHQAGHVIDRNPRKPKAHT